MWVALSFGARLASAQTVPATVYFSPLGGCTAAVVRELEAARSSVYVQAYSFTSAPIAQALVAAQSRGVQVVVILDKSNRTAHYSAADFFVHEGIETRIDAAHAIAHNKVIVIDRSVTITGSFNFTKAAEAKNAENLLVLRDARLAGRYLDNWRLHARHSPLYHSRSGRSAVSSLRMDLRQATPATVDSAPPIEPVSASK